MQFLLDISADNPPNGLPAFFISKPEISLYLSGNDYEFISWGDPICSETFRDELPGTRSIDFIINNLYGHYYYIFYDKNTNEFLVGNSLFSILPLFYYVINNRVILSDNALTLGKHIGRMSISKRFIFESVLFNYPLFNNSVIEGVSLLRSNSFMVISRGGFRIEKHTSIEELFSQHPISVRKSVLRMTDVFLGSVDKYLPEEHYFTALTGGLDGRTLTAAGKYYKRPFSCYCFGTTDSRDLEIAGLVASQTGIPFVSIKLDREYIQKKSFEAGRRFIINSSGMGTFTRAHYCFASEKLEEETRYLVTGNFGSEILRAMHIPGVVISPDLHDLFCARNLDEAFQSIYRSMAVNYLNLREYKQECEEFKEELSSLPCFNQNYKSLSKNKQFYVFVYEELFRKYFGAEMVNHFSIIKKRTPFLDIDFLRELFNTEFAGIHSEFFEHNPVKRYKGQLLYANIIQSACQSLGEIDTDKGYKPSDLLETFGKTRIIKGYIKKQFARKNRSYDPYGVKEIWQVNQMKYQDLPVNECLFNKQKLLAEQSTGLTNTKAKIYSLIYLDNILNNTIKT